MRETLVIVKLTQTNLVFFAIALNWMNQYPCGQKSITARFFIRYVGENYMGNVK